jgi:SanA protein
MDRVEAMAQQGLERGFGSAEARHAGSPSGAGKAIKAMRVILAVVLLVGALVLLFVLVAWLAERRLERLAAPYLAADPAALPDVEVGLVLGAAPIGPEGGPNRYLEYRLDTAAALWRAGKVKYLLASGDRRGGGYDEPTAMRAGLIARGVPASAIYRDFAGVRTRDSVLRAGSVFGQRRLIVVSQGFHAARAVFLARQEGIETWGLEARDVTRAYSIFTELRRYPSALRAYYDVWFDTPPRHAGPAIAIGVDPPN